MKAGTTQAPQSLGGNLRWGAPPGLPSCRQALHVLRLCSFGRQGGTAATSPPSPWLPLLPSPGSTSLKTRALRRDSSSWQVSVLGGTCASQQLGLWRYMSLQIAFTALGPKVYTRGFGQTGCRGGSYTRQASGQAVPTSRFTLTPLWGLVPRGLQVRAVLCLFASCVHSRTPAFCQRAVSAFALHLGTSGPHLGWN